MKIFQTFLLFVALLAASGCSPASAPIEAESTSQTPAQVNFVDSELRDQIHVGPVAVTRDSSDLLHMEMPVRSTTGLLMMIDYRVIFVDENNISVTPSAPWMPATVRQFKDQNLRAASSSTRAADFRIDLRYAR